VKECSKIQDELSAYLDGELAPEDSERVRSHLVACERCRREAEDLRRVAAEVRDLPRVAAPADLRERTLERVRSEGARATTSRLRLVWPAAAAVLIAGALSLYASFSRRTALPGPRYESPAAGTGGRLLESPPPVERAPVPGRAASLRAADEASEAMPRTADGLPSAVPDLKALAHALGEQPEPPVEIFIASSQPEQAMQQVQSLLIQNRIGVPEAAGLESMRRAEAPGTSPLVLHLTPDERALLVQLLHQAQMKPAVTVGQAAIFDQRRKFALGRVSGEERETLAEPAAGKDKAASEPRMPVLLNFVPPPLPPGLIEVPPPTEPARAP